MPDPRLVKEYGNPNRFLQGTYATSYIGYIHTRPGAVNPNSAPQIGGYQLNASGGFDQVDGYRLNSFAAYLDFHGDGNLHGAGWTNRGGTNLNQLTFTGDYTVDQQGPVFTGNYATVDPKGIRVEHYWIMSNNWRRLEFMVTEVTQNGNPYRQFVVAGTLNRIG